jgi:hypothetical protein
MNERLSRALAQFGLEDIAALTDLTNEAEDTPESLPF